MFRTVGTVFFKRSFGCSLRYRAAVPLTKNGVILENNSKSESNRLEKTLKKFWENVRVENSSKGIAIKLDDKCLKTPLGNDLVVPLPKKLLAELIALEWKSLPNLKIKPHQVPLTSIAARAIDLGTTKVSEEQKAKIGDREHINDLLLRYLDTDTLLIFSPNEEYEGKLRQEQDRLYGPIISQIESYLGQFTPSNESVKLNFLDSEKDGLRGNQQSPETTAAARKFLDSLDFWEFVAFEKAVLSSKSFICGVYTIKLLNQEEKVLELELDNIIRACTLETIFQTERWGEVEDTHDVDKEDIRRNLTSAALLAY